MPSVRVITPEIVSPYYTVKEAAKYLKVHVATLSRWRCLKKNPLKFVFCGTLVRFLQKDLDNFIAHSAQRKVGPFVGRPPKNRKQAAARRRAYEHYRRSVRGK